MAAAAPAVEVLPQRRLGKSGERVPVLGMGTGPGGSGLEDADSIRLYETAIDRGVTYVDTAPGYGRARACPARCRFPVRRSPRHSAAPS